MRINWFITYSPVQKAIQRWLSEAHTIVLSFAFLCLYAILLRIFFGKLNVFNWIQVWSVFISLVMFVLFGKKYMFSWTSDHKIWFKKKNTIPKRGSGNFFPTPTFAWPFKNWNLVNCRISNSPLVFGKIVIVGSKNGKFRRTRPRHWKNSIILKK